MSVTAGGISQGGVNTHISSHDLLVAFKPGEDIHAGDRVVFTAAVVILASLVLEKRPNTDRRGDNVVMCETNMLIVVLCEPLLVLLEYIALAAGVPLFFAVATGLL